MGVRPLDGTDYLVVKLSFRKNLTCGVILKRPCFCGMDNDLDRLACPVHSLWPSVKTRVPPGERLFATVNRRNCNRQLQATMAGLSVPQADRYSSHAFRRGPAQEMNETGSPLSVVASAGTWRSNAVRGYIDLSANVAKNARLLFRVGLESESENDVR